MTEIWLVILGLTAATFAIRLAGVLLGQRIPQTGGWARGLKALPGSLIVALVSVGLLQGGPQEWLAGALALATAIATRNLPVTMAVGIAAVWAMRQFGA